MTAVSRKRHEDTATGLMFNPFDRSVIGEVPLILSRAAEGQGLARALPRHARAQILDTAAALILARAEDFATQITAEAGKASVRPERKTRAASTR